MALTNAQLLTLKNFILTVPEWAQLPNTGDAAYFIAEQLAKPAAPSFIVWRTSVPQDEIMQNGFDWARVDNLSVGKARIWQWMFDNESRTFNPSKINVRAGIDATWVGTAADLAVRAAVYTHCKRNATVAEKLFAAGAGSDASPSTLDLEGTLSADDVAQARELA